MKRGLVIGKFYPFHTGHQYLIETARTQCDQLTVLVCDHSDQTIRGTVRARWIQSVFPEIELCVVPDVVPSDDSVGWAWYTRGVLGYAPEIVFTSEAYGDGYAEAMGSAHVSVDRARTTVPISATKIRADVWEHASYLPGAVRAYFLKHVVVVGAESTGTTTLAQDLAKHFSTNWVPEVGRYYSEAKTYGVFKDEWSAGELSWIAQAQVSFAQKLQETASRVLLHDTDPFATELWHERLVGGVNKEVQAYTSVPDLYILTDASIPFVQDGTREGGGARNTMQKRFTEELQRRNLPYMIVRGSRSARLKDAIRAVDAILQRPFSWSRQSTCPHAWDCSAMRERIARPVS